MVQGDDRVGSNQESVAVPGLSPYGGMMRKRKMFEAMDRVVGLPYGPEYQEAKRELDVITAKIQWTIDKWRHRQEERRSRVPAGHDQPDWV